MKQGKSLSELAAEIERQANPQNKRDYIADTRALTMLPTGTLSIKGNGDALPVNSTAHNQIAERLQIPTKYYQRMLATKPALLAANVNEWLQTTPERRMVRTLDGAVRAFLSDRYQRIDNVDVAQTVLPVLHEIPGIRTVSAEITETRLYIKAVTSEVRHTLTTKRVGDIVEAGVMITNSEIGYGAVNVKPYALFLACLNGAVRDKGGMRAAHVGRRIEGDEVAALLTDETKRLEDLAVLSKVRDVVKAAFDAQLFRQWMERWQEASAEQITGDVVQAVEVLGEARELASTERSSILRHLIAGGDLSRFGLANAVTRTAEDVPSYDRATELETMGAQLIELPRGDWRQIAEAKPA